MTSTAVDTATAVAEAEVDVAHACEMVSDLSERRARADLTVAELEAARRPFALPAAIGDKAARAELDKLTMQSTAAAREAADLAMAVEAAKAELGAVEHRLAEAREAHRREQIRKVAAERIAAAEALTKAFSDLGAAFARYTDTGHALQQLAPELVGHALSNWRVRAAVPLDVAEAFGIDRVPPAQRLIGRLSMPSARSLLAMPSSRKAKLHEHAKPR